jgi:phage tail-like protein
MSEQMHRPPRNPEGQAAWRAAAKTRDEKPAAAASGGTSGDSGFYKEGAFTAAFLVEVDGQPVGRFTEAQGMEVSIEVEAFEEGGVNGYVHHLPGRMTWPNLVLKRGVTETDNLFDWVKRCSGDGFTGEGNKITRSTLAVTLVSASGERLRSWNFEGAFPVKWTGPSFAASTDELAMEELEIVHHGFQAPKKP